MMVAVIILHRFINDSHIFLKKRTKYLEIQKKVVPLHPT